MKDIKTLLFQFDINEVELKNENELIILTKQGDVYLYKIDMQIIELLFQIHPDKGIQYADGGFDLEAKSSIYTLDDIVVVVNDFKTHGYVYNGKEQYVIHISREDYYAEHSKFPINLYKDGTTIFLIYGTKWNRVDVVNLETRQILTIDKSLVEVGAEQSRIAFYKEHKESSKLFWPSNFDYFYGELELSPNQTYFMSKGWVWGSSDSCAVFNREDFIHNHRINVVWQQYFEHENRSMCFVDDETIAIVYNTTMEDINDKDEDMIKIVNIKNNTEINISVSRSLNIRNYQMTYKDEHFIFYSNIDGIIVLTKQGEIVHENHSIEVISYLKQLNQMIYKQDDLYYLGILSYD